MNFTRQRGHMKHLGVMAICCAMPFLLLLGIGAYGVNMQSLRYAELIICPLVMGFMMWMMMRSTVSPGSQTEKSGAADGEPALEKEQGEFVSRT